MLQAHPLGAVSHVWRYPVKSLAPEALGDVNLDERGLAGDRRAELVVRSGGHARTGKAYRGKEHELLHLQHDPAAAIALARARSVAIEVRDGGPYFDVDPVSILFDTWLRDGERLVRRALEAQRYRPNFVIHAMPDFASAEADLVDRTLAIGDVRLRVTQPIHRCVTTTYDLATGESDPRILEIVARERDNTMGIYAHVVRAGRIRVGDVVALADD